MKRHFVVSLCEKGILGGMDVTEALAKSTVCVQFIPNQIDTPVWKLINACMEYPINESCNCEMWRKIFLNAITQTAISRPMLDLQSVQIDVIADKSTKNAYETLKAIEESVRDIGIGSIFLHIIFVASENSDYAQPQIAFLETLKNDINERGLSQDEENAIDNRLNEELDKRLYEMNSETSKQERDDLFQLYSKKKREEKAAVKTRHPFCRWNRLSLIFDVSSSGEMGERIKKMQKEILPYVLCMEECSSELHQCVGYSCNKLSYNLNDVEKIAYDLCRKTVRRWNSTGGAPDRRWKICCFKEDAIGLSDLTRMRAFEEQLGEDLDQLYMPTGADLIAFDDNYQSRSSRELLRSFLDDNPQLDIQYIKNCSTNELANLSTIKEFFDGWFQDVGARMINDPNIDTVIEFFEEEGLWQRWFNQYATLDYPEFPEIAEGRFGSQVSYTQRLKNAEKICNSYFPSLKRTIVVARMRMVQQYAPKLCKMAKQIRETREKTLAEWNSSMCLTKEASDEISGMIGSWCNKIEEKLADFSESNVIASKPHNFDLSAYSAWLNTALNAAMARVQNSFNIQDAYRMIAAKSNELKREIRDAENISLLDSNFSVDYQEKDEVYVFDSKLKDIISQDSKILPSVSEQQVMLRIASREINNFRYIVFSQVFMELEQIPLAEPIQSIKNSDPFTPSKQWYETEPDQYENVEFRDWITIPWEKSQNYAIVSFTDEDGVAASSSVKIDKTAFVMDNRICTVPPQIKLYAKRIRVDISYDDNKTITQRIKPVPIKLCYRSENKPFNFIQKIKFGYGAAIKTIITVEVDDIDDVFLPNEIMIKTNAGMPFGYRLAVSTQTIGERAHEAVLLTPSSDGEPEVLITPIEKCKDKYIIERQ